jgi:hypothetical protein
VKGNLSWETWVDEAIYLGSISHPNANEGPEFDGGIEEIGRKLCWQVQPIFVGSGVGKDDTTARLVGRGYHLSVMFWIEPTAEPMPAIASFPVLTGKPVFDLTKEDIVDMTHQVIEAIHRERQSRRKLMAEGKV